MNGGGPTSGQQQSQPGDADEFDLPVVKSTPNALGKGNRPGTNFQNQNAIYGQHAGKKRRPGQVDKAYSYSHKVGARKSTQLNNNGFILPPMNEGLPEDQHREYTLVLDLDETLIHFDQGRRNYAVRPHAQAFIREMAQHYELVIFTAGLKEYADWILNDFDKQGYIRHRLYRNSCRFRRGVYVKDLSKLGRSLAKTIIVDNIAENFDLQSENGINIISWFSSRSDTELLKLSQLLTMFVEQQAEDVRVMIKQYFRQRKNGLIVNSTLTGTAAGGATGASGGAARTRKASAPQLHSKEAAAAAG